VRLCCIDQIVWRANLRNQSLSILVQQVAAVLKNLLKKTCKNEVEITFSKIVGPCLFISTTVTFSHGLVGHMTPDNEDSFKKPLAVAYFNVDYTLNPKGTLFDTFCCVISLFILNASLCSSRYQLLEKPSPESCERLQG
jgi:hypothetical protein